MATGDRRVLKLVDGLKARPALNGAVVEVQSYDSASGRHVVLTTDLESLKLKPSNLLDFADAPPPLLSDARDRGTAAYKARRFHEAVEWYTLAAKADVEDARPLSNRAAAHLEAGDYASCVRDIDAALGLGPDDTSKLWCRRGKALAYAGDVDAALASFRQASELDASSVQLQAALQREPLVSQISPTELSSCRPSPCGVSEFYVISNEDPLSALGGRIVEGEEQPDRVSLGERRSPVRVFFGGIGDGRHGLRTLIDTHQRLPKDAPPVDITLNDVKAEALARDLLVLTLLLELGEALPAGAQLDPSKPRSASAALQVYYVYLGVFMPARQQPSATCACAQSRLHTTLQGLASAEAPPFSWLSCSDASWQALRAVFGRWAETTLGVSLMDSMYTVNAEAASMGNHMANGTPDPEMSACPEMRAELEAAKESSRLSYLQGIEEMAASDLMNIPGLPGSTLAQKREALRAFANSPEFHDADRAAMRVGNPRSLSADYAKEFNFWAASKLLPLPDEWRDAHSSDAYGCTVKRSKAAHMRRTWHANATMVDVPHIGLTCGGQPLPQQELCVDPFCIVKQLTDGDTGLGPLDGRSLFHSAIGALRPAATALAELLSRGQLQLRMECGDAHAVMEQLRMSDSTLLFDRIYLSNVPDYTSMLNAFLYFVPALRGGGDGLFEHELLLNTLMWSSLDQYVFSSSCLRPCECWMLGVRLQSGDHMDRDGRPRWTTCDDGECAERFRNAGRASVESWLHRLLLACVLPSNRDATSRMRESCPQNLSTVFRAVERLKQRGCPAHWLVDFLNAMLAGKLRTACTPPGASPMPLPSGDPCRGKAESTMDLGFCALEARTLAAIRDSRLRLPLAKGPTAIRKHVLHFLPRFPPMDRDGITVAVCCVGLLIVDTSVPQVASTLKSAEEFSPFRRNTGTCRTLACQSPRGSCHLLSVVEWDSQSHAMACYLPVEQAQLWTGSDSTWKALLIRTDSWSAVTASAALALSQPAEVADIEAQD